MKSENILNSDLLDIVFDNRNKAYGAYELRKHYKRRLVKALAIAFVMAAGVVTMVMFIKKEKAAIFEIPDSELAVLKVVEIPKEKPAEPKKPAAPKPPSAPKPLDQQKWVSKIEITKRPEEATKLSNDLDKVAISNITKGGEPYKGEVFVPEPIKIDAQGNGLPKAPAVDRETPQLTADVMPAFPGGMAALRKFLEKNLQNPEDMNEGEVISVKIKFVVGYDGKLKGFQIIEDGGDVYNKEVIRVLKKMPEWVPGKANGENVSVYYTIPVKFTAAQ